MVLRSLSCCASFLALSGCHTLGGVRVTELAVAVEKPSNVGAFVAVTQDGQPVSSLRANAFRVSEDGLLLENQAVDLRLIDPTRAASFHTVLLLDLGQSTTEQGREQLADAAGYFVRNVRTRQSVTVLGFDGSAKVRLLGEFHYDPSGAVGERLPRLPVGDIDSSRDLRGAVVQSIELLEQRLEKGRSPLHVGTLVVFTRGPDMAGRVKASEFDAKLRGSKHGLILVNVIGDSIDESGAVLTRDGKIQAQAVESLPIAFELAAAAVEKLLGHYYFVSYCSPARSYQRHLRLEVQLVKDDLEVESAAIETKFDSSGFMRGCNSANPPRFLVKKPAATAPH